MSIARIAATLVLTALAAVNAPAAQACQITRTNWGLRLIDCNLSDFFKRYDVSLDVIPNPPRLRMPNLQVTDIDGTLGAGVVQIDVEIANSGTLNVASTFEVAVVATVNNPLNAGAPFANVPLNPVSIAGLAVGATTARVVGNATLPNRNQDWDICAIAVVDPALMGGPAWGSIFESNETDNTSNRCCRVYGPKPDTSGPRGC